MFAKNFNHTIVKFIVIFFTLIYFNIAVSHDRQINKGFIQKADNKSLELEFLIDPALLMHKALMPNASLEQSIKRYAEMSPEAFVKEFAQLKQLMAKDIKIIGADGKRLAPRSFKLQPHAEWQYIFKTQIVLLEAFSNEAGHLPQMKINITFKSGKNLSQAQFSVPGAMFPILMRNMPADEFWLSDQIPFAIVHF
ncbi:MAG: hypothetical protein ACKVOY_17395 [Burkholderiaceae bacterium]